jgi:hypothetical protein
MDFSRLKKLLQPWYGELNPAIRADHAERVARKALGWARAGRTVDFDRDLLTLLAYLLPVRDVVLKTTSNKNAVEAALVEQGWPPLQCRELFHSLARLPDKPTLPEEKLVTDADTLLRYGVLGFARQVALTTGRGESLDAGAESMMRSLSIKLHTAEGLAEAPKPKLELHQLVLQLKKSLEEEKR